MNILALDMALTTGWAHSDGSSGTFTVPKLEEGRHNGYRFVEFARELSDILQKHETDSIAYEKAHHRGGATTRLCVGWVTIVEFTAAFCGILAVKGYHSGTIKKHATGDGKATKDDMRVAALARNPTRTYIDDNEVDALWVLDLALNDRELDG